jgi:hypothetical protein
MPSLAPSTAARSQPMRSTAWRSVCRRSGVIALHLEEVSSRCLSFGLRRDSLVTPVTSRRRSSS